MSTPKKANVTISRVINSSLPDRICIAIEWPEGRLKVDMTLEEYAYLITGRNACLGHVAKWVPLP